MADPCLARAQADPYAVIKELIEAQDAYEAALDALLEDPGRPVAGLRAHTVSEGGSDKMDEASLRLRAAWDAARLIVGRPL